MKPGALYRCAVVLLLLGASACSILPGSGSPQEAVLVNPEKADLTNASEVTLQLHRAHQTWQGTGHVWGGLSHSGIDCSGLVYNVYRTNFGIELPRTTKQQARIGRQIARSALRPGDLVFFKTGVNVRHVGIYVEDGQFLHVSTKKGVTLSKLSNVYWKSKYWHARRLVG